MAAPLYISAEEFKAALDLSGLPFEDAAVDRAVGSACRAVEKMTGRVFYPSPLAALDADAPGVPEARLFTAVSGHRVLVGDLLEVSEVATRYGSDWLVWDAAEYGLEPANAGSFGEPFDMVVPLGRCFPELARQGVRVSGRWGWETPPEQVAQASMLLAHRLFERKKAPFGIATWGSVDMALRIARTDPDLAVLLDGISRRAVVA